MSDIPLTPEQRLFAAENHDLVYAFLKEKNLPESDFYDIVIFGFLRAVRRYFTETALREYKFSTIAWNCMYVDLCNHFKAQHRQKRTATVISIHVPRYDDGLRMNSCSSWKPDFSCMTWQTMCPDSRWIWSTYGAAVTVTGILPESTMFPWIRSGNF